MIEIDVMIIIICSWMLMKKVRKFRWGHFYYFERHFNGALIFSCLSLINSNLFL